MKTDFTKMDLSKMEERIKVFGEETYGDRNWVRGDMTVIGHWLRKGEESVTTTQKEQALRRAYAAAIDHMLPKGDRRRRIYNSSRRRALTNAKSGQFKRAKFFAIKARVDREALEATEMLMFGEVIVPQHNEG